MSPPKRGDAPRAKPTPVRVTSVYTERTRRRAREVEQPIINITLQPDERRVFSVVEAAAVLGISRSKLYEFIAAGDRPGSRRPRAWVWAAAGLHAPDHGTEGCRGSWEAPKLKGCAPS